PNLYSSHFSAQVSLAVLARMNSRSASLAQRCRCPGHASQLLGRVSPPRLVQDWLVEQAGVEPLVPHETDTIHDHPDRPLARLIEERCGGDQEFESALLRRRVCLTSELRGYRRRGPAFAAV